MRFINTKDITDTIHFSNSSLSVSLAKKYNSPKIKNPVIEANIINWFNPKNRFVKVAIKAVVDIIRQVDKIILRSKLNPVSPLKNLILLISIFFIQVIIFSALFILL